MAKEESSKPPGTAETDDEAVDFEESLAKAEQILARLESGQLGLTESLEQYETGIRQLKRCHALLDAAEQRVTLLSGFDADGNPVEEPMRRAGGATSSGVKRGDQVSADDQANGDSVDEVPGLF